MQMRIAGIVQDSIVDGEGIRLTVFVQGWLSRRMNNENARRYQEWAGMLQC